jgi:CRISPR/Cas system CSM-associated protein Csm2 small subunit
MNQLVNFFDHFNNDLKGNPIWENIEIKCVKYEPFLRGEHGGPISNYNTFKNILVPKVKQLNVLPFNQNKGGNEDNAE